MSDELSDFFALPPFKADEALVQLRRQLRELKPLQEQGTGPVTRIAFKGLPVIELQLLDAAGAPSGKPAIQAALAKRPSSRPEWGRSTLDSSAAVRKWLDEVKRQLPRWSDED